jgi:two-component system sensor histidine kinase KdpD
LGRSDAGDSRSLSFGVVKTFALGGALSLRRRLAGFALAAIGLPALMLLLPLLGEDESITIDVLAFQLLVVLVALVGGIWPAVLSAIGAGVLLDFFFVAPFYSITIADPLHLIALVVFLIVAVLVSTVVDQAARRSRIATRAVIESETLADIAGSVLRGQDALQALVSRLRESFGMASVTLRTKGEVMYAAVDDSIASEDDEETRLAVGPDATLHLRGSQLRPSDRRILGAFLSQIEAALRQRELAAEAERMRPVAEADRLRTALLASVGHDLRRPLAAATAAVTSLRSQEVALTDADKSELLEAAEVSLDSLADLITQLLDASRLQAGVLGVEIAPTALDDVVLGALDELGLAPGEVNLELEETPAVRADAVLLQRVVVNLLANALRFAPEGSPPTIASNRVGEHVQLRVIDTGPGIPANRREHLFAAFQRLGDTDNTTGIGLGLALSKGFVESMGGSIEATETPGGGLTMIVDLEVHL